MRSLLTIFLIASNVSAFLAPTVFRPSSLVIRHDTEEPLEDSMPKIPQLPPAVPGRAAVSLDQQQPTPVVGDKFEIQYTCKKCDTRNANKVSRVAYRNGVVICICKGCMAKHWIADNLGWSDYVGGFEGDTNIEEYFARRGKDEVSRVTEEVFEVEKIWDASHDFLQ